MINNVILVMYKFIIYSFTMRMSGASYLKLERQQHVFEDIFIIRKVDNVLCIIIVKQIN